MASRHRTSASLSAPSTQRPDSRASTMSAISQHNDMHRQTSQLSQVNAFAIPMGTEPEAALLQYSAGLNNQAIAHYDISQQHIDLNHQQHTQNVPLQFQRSFVSQDAKFWAEEMAQVPQSRPNSVPAQTATETQDERRRKATAMTATNDRELREILAKHEGRSLKDVAQEVIQKERTPMAEKTKQLFAMLWLRAVCKPAKTSVPRNRVYSQYASRCGTERVVPLNPASFGKLVRVIFPGIQTRRLGVRGESKYHYVDLALDEDHANIQSIYATQGISNFEQQTRPVSAGAPHIDFNTVPRAQADTAAFPLHESFEPPPPVAVPTASHAAPSVSRAFAYPDTQGMRTGTVETLAYEHALRFPSGNIPAFSENESVVLPSIEPYLPPRTDQDVCVALVALYRTHCTSLIDSIRFCKEKQFFRLYTSFQGTLTVPTQKLFVHPNLAPWIEQCDLVMYRTMVRFVSRLTLQAAPVIVINILGNISANLHAHIAKTFSVLPQHVLEAKLRPATIFASLLHRLIRVNQSAHAAANLLTIDQNREQMWREWVTMVNPKRVMESELPNCGYDEVYKILTTEMRGLLEPLQAPAYQDDPYALSPYTLEENGSFANLLAGNTTQPSSRNGPSAVSTETVLDRWSAFIISLPARFPNASTRTLLHCISAVGTAALRDITIMNGISFGHWWVLKIFVDEMSLWSAEMGGFLEPMVDQTSSAGNKDSVTSPAIEASQDPGESRFSSMDADASAQNLNLGSQQQQQQQIYPVQGPQQQQQQQQQHEAFESFFSQNSAPIPSKHQQPMEHDIDDSGIGMSLMDEDLNNLSKYGMPSDSQTTHHDFTTAAQHMQVNSM